jgi:hypothetical protein
MTTAKRVTISEWFDIYGGDTDTITITEMRLIARSVRIKKPRHSITIYARDSSIVTTREAILDPKSPVARWADYWDSEINCMMFYLDTKVEVPTIQVDRTQDDWWWVRFRMPGQDEEFWKCDQLGSLLILLAEKTGGG